jgi:peptidoglycan/xylan/chitin deacetylase (PgdA/CDA1 family)
MLDSPPRASSGALRQPSERGVRYASRVPARRRRPLVFPAALAVLVAVSAAAVGTLLAGSDRPEPPQPTVAAASDHAAHPATPAASPSATRSIAVVRGAAARRSAVPILMYHVLGDPPASAPLPELWVSKAKFAAQVRALAAAGYQAVTLKAVFGAWQHGGPLPKRPVVFSFDDGYLSQATIAEPILRRRGWPGVVNVTVHNLGPNGLPRHLAQDMAKSGWEIDSHTLTHPDLRTISAAQLRKELVESRKQLAALTGTAPEFFCYPAGKYDARVEAAVKAAGYIGATTVEPGLARRSADPFQLPRLRITNADSGSALVQRIAGAT